ncbi:hypothetical protein AAMO2058_000811400 [Amorphochlora amoebiformis]
MAGEIAFHTTRSVLAGPGVSGKVGSLFRRMGCKRVLVVTDRGVEAAGLLTEALKGISNNLERPIVYNEVVNDPPESVVHSAVQVARESKIDAVLGIGGGSAMDVAKLVACLCPENAQTLESFYGVEQAQSSYRLPLIQVPTTAGTGSEVTPISIITTGTNEKKGVVDPLLLPDWAILDPSLTLSLPRHVTAATGIDAMVHAIEAYTTRFKKNFLSDALAREALRLLSYSLRTACDQPKDMDARMDTLKGAMLAGMAFANAPVGAVHALAYPIGSHFHQPHGLSNSLMLPHILQFNAQLPTPRRQYAELGPYILSEFEGFGSEEEVVEGIIEYYETLPKELGLATTLRGVGIQESDIELLSTEAMKQTRLLPNNPREVTLKDAQALYERAL